MKTPMNHPDQTRYIFPELWSASHTDHIANLEQALLKNGRELERVKEELDRRSLRLLTQEQWDEIMRQFNAQNPT